MDQIKQIDERWMNGSFRSSLLPELLNNKASFVLNEFMRGHGEFKEIFITDDRGVIIALTNKTSDYYQADESWWTKAFHGGPYIDEIEYDERASTWSYPVYERIYDEKNQCVGVIKAILSIQGIH